MIYEPVENLKVQDAPLIVSEYWREVFEGLAQREYEFTKKKSEDDAEEDEKSKTEWRKPKKDETLPAKAWEDWVAAENERLRASRNLLSGSEEIEEVKPPRHLKIYFKLGTNEKVEVAPTSTRARTKRGISKPARICRLTSIGSHAMFVARDAMPLQIVINPWKAHVEQTDLKQISGQRILKGDCLWLKKGKRTGAGWYRVTEMSPAKFRLSGEVQGAELMMVPAWLDVNQMVQAARIRERNETARRKIKRDLWETRVDGAALLAFAQTNAGTLRIKRRYEILTKHEGA